MITAGIKEVKNNLSRYLAQVKSGEEILITERGKPVARLVKDVQNKRGIRDALLPLIKSGSITLPSKRVNKDKISAMKSTGKPISEMVIEDRR